MPVKLRAKCIGSVAAQELSGRNLDVIGEVTHTFSNSFYLKTVDDALVFVTNRATKSPITINLDSTCSLDQIIRAREQLYTHGKEIQTEGGACIDLSEARLYHNQSCQANDLNTQFYEIAESLRLASFILGVIDTSQSLLDRQGLAHKGVVGFVRNGVLPLRLSSANGSFRDAALSILGLGYGFTPSGDDFLGGFLAAYNSLAGSIEREPVLLNSAELQERTSWVSSILLDYMQRQVLDEQLSEIICSASQGQTNVFIQALEALFPRGHTSGIDISAGIILALSLVRDIAFEKKETEEVAGRLGMLS